MRVRPARISMASAPIAVILGNQVPCPTCIIYYGFSFTAWSLQLGHWLSHETNQTKPQQLLKEAGALPDTYCMQAKVTMTITGTTCTLAHAEVPGYQHQQPPQHFQQRTE